LSAIHPVGTTDRENYVCFQGNETVLEENFSHLINLVWKQLPKGKPINMILYQPGKY
jgi:hypothetical protein